MNNLLETRLYTSKESHYIYILFFFVVLGIGFITSTITPYTAYLHLYSTEIEVAAWVVLTIPIILGVFIIYPKAIFYPLARRIILNNIGITCGLDQTLIHIRWADIKAFDCQYGKLTEKFSWFSLDSHFVLYSLLSSNNQICFLRKCTGDEKKNKNFQEISLATLAFWQTYGFLFSIKTNTFNEMVANIQDYIDSVA